MPSVIDLLRHGEPRGGRAFRGNRIDDPLSETGWQQMRSVSPPQPGWERVITSPMRRCREFAQEVANTIDVDCEVIEDLKEVGFGDWEGKTPQEIQATSPESYRAFYEDPVLYRPAGAEPLDDFFKRVTNAFDSIVEQNENKHTLVVTHAGVIRAIVAATLKAPLNAMYQLRIDYAGLCRIRYDGKLVKLDTFNTDRYRKP